MTSVAELAGTGQGEVRRFLIKDIRFNQANAILRGFQDDDDPRVVEMEESIRRVGLLQLPAVDPLGVLVAGERRVRALRRMGVEDVDCLVKDGFDAAEMTLALLEANRESLRPGPLYEAAVIEDLLRRGCTHDQVARRLGVTTKWVEQRRRFATDLAECLTQALEQRKEFLLHFDADMLAALSVLPQAEQEALMPRFEGAHTQLSRMRTPEDVEAFVSTRMLNLSSAAWKLSDETLVPEAGSCDACPDQTKNALFLFEAACASTKDARCLNRGCFLRKAQAEAARRFNAMVKKNPDAVVVTQGDLKVDADRTVHEIDIKGEAKKGDKDSTAAVFITIDGQVTEGRVFLKGPPTIKAVPREKPARGSAAASERVKSPDESLADAVQKLSRQRRALVIDKVAKAVDGIATGSFAERGGMDMSVMRMIVAYGCQPVPGLRKDAKSREAQIAMASVSKDGAMLRSSLWPRVKGLILDDLKRTNPSELDAEYETARWLSVELGIGFAKFEDDAEKEIPEPKSVARLRRQATPPKPEKKAAKKPEKKQKKTGKRR